MFKVAFKEHFISITRLWLTLLTMLCYTLMQPSQPQLGYGADSRGPRQQLNVVQHDYAWYIPDVGTVCFGLVNWRVVGHSTLISWLQNTMVNQPESG